MNTSERDPVYHDGELAVQRRVGQDRMARINGTAIGARIPGGALSFIGQQPMAIVGSLDTDGRVWASVLTGPPGFLKAADTQSLTLDLTQPRSHPDDPLWRNLGHDPRLGLLLIELGSRRRLRVNGRAHRRSQTEYAIDVEQAYPNCPKYIQRRHWTAPGDDPPGAPGASRRGTRLTPEQRDWIARTDTFFVASAHPERGVDASHRGGQPGFVRITGPMTLRIPDFAGNSMFNTLGNFVSYPRAGLVFVDFARRRVLQLTGRPEILWDLDDPRGQTGGTRRYWELQVQAWQESELAFRLHWELLDDSPFNPRPTGPESAPVEFLVRRVDRVRDEAEGIKSFRLVAPDGRALPAFEAGAHLPIRVRLADGAWAERHYSLVSDPADRGAYEIGVLLEPGGSVGSRFLHEQITQGDRIETGLPRNAFPLVAGAQHSILIAGGIGITPILAMLRRLVCEDRSFELHYSERRASHLAFRAAIEAFAANRAWFCASREAGGSRIDVDAVLP